MLDRAVPILPVDNLAVAKGLWRGVVIAWAAVLLACAPPPDAAQTVDGPPVDLKASAAELFEQYGIAISTPRREALAGFYVVDGAIRILNGGRRDLSRAQLDSIYRERWNPPEYFAWEQLSYDSLGPGLVLVTGGFLYQPQGQPDTARYLYTAVVEASDSGMAIRFEGETLRPEQ